MWKEKKWNCSDPKIEIEVMKTQAEGILEMKNLGMWIETTEASFTNRIQKMKWRILGIEDTREEMET